MHKGRDIVELAMELKRRAESAEDYVVPANQIDFEPFTKQGASGALTQAFALGVPGVGLFETSEHTQGQIAERLEIPRPYFRRMAQLAPDLLKTNVSHWLGTLGAQGKSLMVRTLDGCARALLSDRFHRLDNYDVAEAVLPVLLESQEIRIESADVTDSRLYLQARFPKVEGEVKVNDPVQMGVVITNSEIGLGALEVRPMVYRLVCKNGMVSSSDLSEASIRRQHVGAKVSGDGAFRIYRPETVAATDQALFMQMQDTIAALANGSLFEQLLARMRAAAASAQAADPVQAVEKLAKTFDLRGGEKNAFLENLIRDGDYSKWGAVNAVTQLAHHASSYDRSFELEQIGGRILDLSASEWERVVSVDSKLAA